MTESETALFKDRISKNLPSGPAVDPDASHKGDPDAMWKMREAEQAHDFRGCAFGCSITFCVILAFAWLGFILIRWPPDDASPAFIALYVAKSSLMTIVLIALAVSIMRFVIKCYGHHNTKDDSTDISPGYTKFAETVAHFIVKKLTSGGTN